MMSILISILVFFLAFPPPANNLYIAIFLFIFLLYLSCGSIYFNRNKIKIFVLVLFLTKLVQFSLPSFYATEGHNIFLLGKGEEVYKEGIPKEVFKEFKEKFLAVYDLEKACQKNMGNSIGLII